MTALVRVDRDADGRVRTHLRAGHLAPRVLDRGPDHVRIALVATVALLLADDDVVLTIDIASDVEVEIVETAATVAYDMRGGRARWQVSADVAAGATLLWDALPFVVSDGADVDRSLQVRLGDGAVALLRETVVLGRSGQRGGTVRARTDARCVDGSPLLREDLSLAGDTPDLLVLGDARVLDTVTLLGARLPRTGPDVLQLDVRGTQQRWLGHALHESPLAGLVSRHTVADCVRGDIDRPRAETARQ